MMINNEDLKMDFDLDAIASNESVKKAIQKKMKYARHQHGKENVPDLKPN